VSFPEPEQKGKLQPAVNVLGDYTEAVLDNARVRSFGDLKIVVDAGNGMAGLILPTLFDKVGSEPVSLYWQLDGSFPNHEANPLKIETLDTLRQTVMAEKADLGAAYDGDADRVAFVTEKGEPDIR
jgi:phosphomannomutase